MKTLYNIINIGKLITIISFVLGTCLLVSFILFPKEDSIVMIGLHYVGYAIVINAILLLFLIITAFVYWDQRITVFKTCGLLLLNIPIAIAYFFIVITYIFS
ncbi:hypothetical protein [Winogradskyella sp. R77965]|uniref:hypothetical protein n=1 Tax=Winogradskyella sp. R77965 TaxID=3093872 RepID=UPI0037DC33DB